MGVTDGIQGAVGDEVDSEVALFFCSFIVVCTWTLLPVVVAVLIVSSHNLTINHNLTIKTARQCVSVCVIVYVHVRVNICTYQSLIFGTFHSHFELKVRTQGL